MSIETMKQALEALEYDNPSGRSATINKLRQAIEQAEKQEGWVLREVYFSEGEPISHREPQAEPVAWAEITKDYVAVSDDPFENAIPLYTAPVHASDISQERVDETAKRKDEWVGFAHEELAWLNEALNLGGRFAVIEAIEAKLKEKNHDTR
jgi:hypothetical protein